MQDERVLHSLMDALAVSEFLATFSAVCGAPQLNLAQLQQAVAWPLDGPELFEVYTVLVKYLLAQWVSDGWALQISVLLHAVVAVDVLSFCEACRTMFRYLLAGGGEYAKGALWWQVGLGLYTRFFIDAWFCLACSIMGGELAFFFY